jgi:nitrogenase molybdenum-iron protein alpha/beta subunit
VHAQPENLGHVALHLAKYAGELAGIAEHLQHADPRKREKGVRLARRWLQGRQFAVVWCLDTAQTRLEEAMALLAASPTADLAEVVG